MGNDLCNRGGRAIRRLIMHTDLVIMLSAFASAMLWMNSKFNEIEKDIAIIKNVVVTKNIMPSELAKCNEAKPKEGD
jgi:hypothetical protein